ncbi:GGDEF domain-containing protein [Jeongeupia wiesaeckerbachi]|uniref:GGDEF domain-containing protein n=1 Tax=Jeongeupia wiesaeckerbachi TaxID=3051218 RepID=UPI003D8096CA
MLISLSDLLVFASLLLGVLVAGQLVLLGNSQHESGLGPLALAGALTGLTALLAALGMAPLAVAAWVFAESLFNVALRRHLLKTPHWAPAVGCALLAFLLGAAWQKVFGNEIPVMLAAALAIVPLAVLRLQLLRQPFAEERAGGPRLVMATVCSLHAAYWLAILFFWAFGQPGWWGGAEALVLECVLFGLFQSLLWPQLVAQKLRGRLARLARYDVLTWALNRRGFEEVCLRELRRARKHERSLGLLLVDIDRMHAINSRYGHAGGDHVLRTCAAALRSHLRPEDSLGRIGGDSFCILAPHRNEAELQTLLAELREALTTIVSDYDDIAIRVSAGVSMAMYPNDGVDFPVLYGQAQSRLRPATDGPASGFMVARG